MKIISPPVQLLLLLFSTMLLNTAYGTDIDGELSLGIVNFDIDHPNSVAGKYSGVRESERRVLAEFDLNIHSGESYLQLDGDRLGLDSRQLGVAWGQHGLFALSFQHQRIKTFSAVDALTPYDGVGSERLTLPDSFVQGATPADMNLAEHLKPLDLTTRRRGNRLELVSTPNDNWYAKAAFFREERSGTESLGGLVGIARRADSYPAIVLPAPVNQTTSNIEAALGHHNQKVQWEMNYQWSQFNNRESTLSWDNPYNGRTDYPEQALISLDPDNSYYNLGFSGALNFTSRARLVLSSNIGKMKQESTLLNYTINPDVLITAPLTRKTAQAEVETRRLHLKFSSKPLRRLSLNLGYNYDKSRNNTRIDLFQRVVNDTGEIGGTEQSAIDSNRAVYNRPYQQTRARLKLDGGYYFGRGTSLKLALSQESVDRSYRAVETTRERSVSAKLNSRLSPQLNFALGLQRDKRRADGGYDQSRVYQVFHTREYIDTISSGEQFDNNPALRQYDIADRERDNINLHLNIHPHPDLIIGLYHQLNRDSYSEELLGLNNQKQRTTTLDLSYTPHQSLTLFGYISREWINFTIDGRNFNSAGPPGTKERTANDPDNNWRLRNRDTLDTIGAGSRFSLLRGDLAISINAFYSRERNRIDYSSGANLSTEPLPQDYARRKGIEIEGDYYLNSQLDIRLGVTFESFRDSEWSRDSIPPGSDASEELITLKGPEPDYTAYVVYTALKFKW